MPEQQNPEQQLEYLKELRRKYEEALSNAQKSGDYSEATKLKDELDQRLSALEALFPKPEAKAENQEVESKEVTEIRAREIMGEDFFGGNEIEKAFGVTLANSYYSNINSALPYSERDLLEAKKNGEMLIYRVGDYVVSGITNFITMHELYNIARVKMTPDDFMSIKGFGQSGNELSYYGDIIRSRWVLVRKDFIPDSTNRDYENQTRVLRDYLKTLGVLTNKELQSSWDIVLKKILNNPDNDRQEKAKKLTDLIINQRYRRSPVEAFYDWMLLKSEKKDNKLYSNTYEWTNGLDSEGRIIGASINLQEFRCIPQSYDNRLSSFGVISAR